MNIQTAMDKNLPEAVYRVVQNGYTKTATVTAASVGLGIGYPVVLATASASVGSNFIVPAITSTGDVNNLYIGNVHRSLGTVYSYLNGEDVGLVQCYGVDDDAAVYCGGTALTGGLLLVPELSLGLTTMVNPTTAAATATAAHGAVAALGGLAVLAEAVASSSATRIATAKVLLRCM